MKKLIHKTADGDDIFLEDMKDTHLINTIKMQIRKSKEGIDVPNGCFEYYEIDTVYGEEALEYFHHKQYLAEAKRRGFIKYTSFEDMLLSELDKTSK